MASSIKGYTDAIKRYHVRAVCAVGMGQTGTQIQQVRDKNKIPRNIPLFTLQGNFDVKKLHGVYKMMMSIMVKTARKALADKKDRTPEEDDMLDMMMNGGERVKVQNLKSLTGMSLKNNELEDYQYERFYFCSIAMGSDGTLYCALFCTE